MSLVVFLRGLNVGGHRNFRPTTLARQLRHLDAVNIGAAGTFVIRKTVGRSELRKEIARRLPFEAEIVICRGREILDLLSIGAFDDVPPGPDVVRFVSVLSRRPRSVAKLPITLPLTRSGCAGPTSPRRRGRREAAGEGWLVRVLAVEGPFVLGLYRRHMRVIGYLGSLDRVFGVPVTTRNWNTIAAIGKVLSEQRSRRA